MRDVTGVDTTTDHIPVHGMLDPDIIRRMLEDAGASSRRIRRAMPSIVERSQSLYVRRCPDLRAKTCPGVRALLARL
ncbi:MAG: hypothetical protein L0271_05095, partial [Gemmatimonadetes bacterium]|nr:hypothetical protein [Gemmatimonadota bacterium]